MHTFCLLHIFSRRKEGAQSGMNNFCPGEHPWDTSTERAGTSLGEDRPRARGRAGCRARPGELLRGGGVTRGDLPEGQIRAEDGDPTRQSRERSTSEPPVQPWGSLLRPLCVEQRPCPHRPAPTAGPVAKGGAVATQPGRAGVSHSIKDPKCLQITVTQPSTTVS